MKNESFEAAVLGSRVKDVCFEQKNGKLIVDKRRREAAEWLLAFIV